MSNIDLKRKLEKSKNIADPLKRHLFALAVLTKALEKAFKALQKIKRGL